MVIPFCPNPRCLAHHPSPNSKFVFKKNGHHNTKVMGPVQRYRCTHCGKTFCDRTFALDYWTRKLLDYMEIFRAASEGENLSAVARNLHCDGKTIQNRIGRLSRNCIAMHHAVGDAATLSENLVADGFESFDKSQFFPSHVPLLVGQTSQYCYSFSHASCARKGAMTKAQRIKKEAIANVWTSTRGAVKSSFAVILGIIPPKWDKKKLPELELITDQHPAYPGSIRSVPALRDAIQEGQLLHSRYSSKIRRDTRNPLFPVNYLDRELRKDVAAHARESTCFNRNVANGLERLTLYFARHNYWKPFRVRAKREEETRPHAEVAGFDKAVIEEAKDKLFTHRAFATKTNIDKWEADIWLRKHKTPLKTGREYLPKHVCP